MRLCGVCVQRLQVVALEWPLSLKALKTKGCFCLKAWVIGKGWADRSRHTHSLCANANGGATGEPLD